MWPSPPYQAASIPFLLGAHPFPLFLFFCSWYPEFLTFGPPRSGLVELHVHQLCLTSKFLGAGVGNTLLWFPFYITVFWLMRYVAPEYASTGMLTEKSDVFSYGVLVMELITGRVPVDRNRPPGEEKLVDWLKSMVGSRQSEEVTDPKMVVKPSVRSLKRVLLVALRCVDPDATKRPTMGHVVHMLETADDNPVSQDSKLAEAYHLGKNEKQMPTIIQKHKFFARPAFMVAQKNNNAEKVGQNGVPYKEGKHDGGLFIDIIDSKATWKYER